MNKEEFFFSFFYNWTEIDFLANIFEKKKIHMVRPIAINIRFFLFIANTRNLRNVTTQQVF